MQPQRQVLVSQNAGVMPRKFPHLQNLLLDWELVNLVYKFLHVFEDVVVVSEPNLPHPDNMLGFQLVGVLVPLERDDPCARQSLRSLLVSRLNIDVEALVVVHFYSEICHRVTLQGYRTR